LGKGQKVAHIADRKGSVGSQALSYRLKKAMTAKSRSNEYPIGWLMLIADALWLNLMANAGRSTCSLFGRQPAA